MEKMKTDLIITNYKYYNVKAEDVLDKYGNVKDVEFAKYLINIMWNTTSNMVRYSNLEDYLKKVNDRLEAVGGGFSIRNEDTGYYSLGGPGGYSGLWFQTLDEYIKEQEEYDYDYIEEMVNNEEKAIVYLDGKITVFIGHETD